MKSFFTALLLFSFLYPQAQALAPFQWEDDSALTITPEVLNKLQSTEWVLVKRCYEFKGIESPSSNISRGQIGQVLYGPDSLMVSERRDGKWFVHQQKILMHLWRDEKWLRDSEWVQGPFAIYSISDSSLVLAKLLTSDNTWRKYSYFKAGADAGNEAVVERLESAKQFQLWRNSNASKQKDSIPDELDLD